MRPIENTIIHCSDSPWGCAREIRQWHLAKGWNDIAYHFVILNGQPTFLHYENQKEIFALDGSIECGRYLDDDGFISDVEKGAHALGYNQNSIGICLVGMRRFSERQMASLVMLAKELATIYRLSPAHFLGHYETKSGQAQKKTCPNIDMKWLRDRLR
jgi:hypothetical protein